MNIPAGTGDWFGGWDGDEKPQPQLYANEDASRGRMVELIERGQPAVMLCHWPGLYSHGTKQGFLDFQKVVTALAGRFSKQTLWMKLSAIGRYWAARELTKMSVGENRQLSIDAPLSCPDFTIRLNTATQYGADVAYWPIGNAASRNQFSRAARREHILQRRTNN